MNYELNGVTRNLKELLETQKHMGAKESVLVLPKRDVSVFILSGLTN